MKHPFFTHVLLGSTALTLAACGGGGSTGTAFIPPPPVTPTPTPTPTPAAASITIFANPTIGEYASVGASISGHGGNLDTYGSANDRFGTVSSSDPQQPHIRYNAAGYYEIEMPAAQWDRLVPYGGILNPDPSTNNYFQPQSIAMNLGYLVTNNSRNSGYSYSELGGWGSASAARWGYTAFGEPTPAGGVPVTGTATFNGTVSGNADIMQANNLYGGFDPIYLAGTATLNFDFAKGSLGGSMNLSLIGVFNLTQTVFSAGSTTYSGKFDTSAAGDNFFLGRFTGPHAEETIGTWALPFVYSGDGQTHQAFGAWIAKH
jgi:hypothetical protein